MKNIHTNKASFMNKEEQLAQLVEETFNSADNIKRATPKPFLLTRIHARLQQQKEKTLEKTSWHFGKPAIALSAMALLILINSIVVVYDKSSGVSSAAEQITTDAADDFNYTVSTIYDIENTEPQ